MTARGDLGRPLELDDVCDTVNGTPVTIADRILEWASLAFRSDWSAARAGVARPTFEKWARDAARIRARIAMNPEDLNQLTGKEQRLLRFHDDLDRVAAEGVARYHLSLVNIGRGGKPVRVTTKRYVRGQLVEETTREEVSAPDPKVLMWLLERAAPDVYGRHLVVEVQGGGPDPLTRPERQAGLARIINAELAVAPLSIEQSNGHHSNGHDVDYGPQAQAS